MDTRKLEVLKCASIDIGNGDGFQEVPELIFPADCQRADFHTLGYAFSYEDAAELVTRWNAYPDLIAQRDELLAAVREAKGTLAAIAEMSQRHNPETGFLRDLNPYDTYRALLPTFQRLIGITEKYPEGK